MSQIKPQHFINQQTIATANVNKVFSDLEDNTDGTTDRIVADNIAKGGIGREHLASTGIVDGSSIVTTTGEAATKTLTGTGSDATTVPTATTTIKESTGLSGKVMRQGDVLRYSGSAMVREMIPDFTAKIDRLNQFAYFSVWGYFSPTDGGLDYWTQISPNMGFSFTNGPWASETYPFLVSSGVYGQLYQHGLRQVISGAYIFPSTTTANVEKLVLKCHLEDVVHTIKISNSQVYGMLLRN